jgi:hypothetical protein
LKRPPNTTTADDPAITARTPDIRATVRTPARASRKSDRDSARRSPPPSGTRVSTAADTAKLIPFTSITVSALASSSPKPANAGPRVKPTSASAP